MTYLYKTVEVDRTFMRQEKSTYIYEIKDINPEMLANEVLYLYGCGKPGRELCKKLRASAIDLPLLVYIDDFSDLSNLDECSVVPSYKIHHNHENTIITNRFIATNPKFSQYPRYIMDLPADQTANEKDIDIVSVKYISDRLDDRVSKCLYQALIDLRKAHLSKSERFAGLHGLLTEFPYKEQYCEFLPDALGFVVDGGFLNGESSRAIVRNREYQKVFGFDPQMRLESNVDRDFELSNLALGRGVSRAYFQIDSENETDSRMFHHSLNRDPHRDGEDLVTMNDCFEVDVTSIDVYFSYMPKNSLIKTDLEGADYDAIIGGINNIKRFRPYMAISIYHSDVDMIRIPLLLMKELVDYSFYIRHYSLSHNETVLYCVPKER